MGMAAWALPLRPQMAEYQLRVSESLGSAAMDFLRRWTARLGLAFLRGDEAEQAEAVGRFGIEAESFVGAGLCLDEILRVGGDAGVDVLPVDLAFGGEEEHVFADEAFSHFEIFEGAGQSFAGVVEDLVLGHQVVAVGVGVGHGARDHLTVFRRAELDLECGDDLAGDVFLNGEDVFERAGIFVGPEERVAARDR